MSEAEKLYETLKSIQEPKGYFFNEDRERVMDLLEALLLNRKRYGYMSCPCRLASGDREKDRDILCPCVYREPDVAQYGSCYCNLYVSREWNEGKMPREYVPERRPPENSCESDESVRSLAHGAPLGPIASADRSAPRLSGFWSQASASYEGGEDSSRYRSSPRTARMLSDMRMASRRRRFSVRAARSCSRCHRWRTGVANRALFRRRPDRRRRITRSESSRPQPE